MVLEMVNYFLVCEARGKKEIVRVQRPVADNVWVWPSFKTTLSTIAKYDMI